MKGKDLVFETLLPVVVGVALLVCVLLRSFVPGIVLPKLDIPAMGALILVAALGDHYLGRGAERCYGCVALFAAAAFGLLPVMAGLSLWAQAPVLGAVGGVTAVVLLWLFDWARDRLSTGPAAEAAPVLTAVGLALALQCFTGILL